MLNIQRKLVNVQHLVQQYDMTAILETHVTGAKAELFFCRYVEGTRRFFIHGMAVFVQEAWADCFNPALVTIVDGVIVALEWECDGSKHFAFFVRLDADAEVTRIHQLRQATRLAKENVSSADIVVFAGDRNFVRSDSERWSSASSVWRPSLRMNAAWDEWLFSMGNAYEVVQPEFTWDVSTLTLLIMPRGSVRSLIWWVPTLSLTLHMESGARLVVVMTCPIHVPQIIGLWDSGGLVPSENENLKIPLTTSFTDLYHRGRLLDNVEFQRVADDCGLQTETMGSLVCRLLLVRCMLVPPHFSLLTSSLPRQHVRGWS